MADQLAPKAAGNNPTRMAIYSRKQYDQIPRPKEWQKTTLQTGYQHAVDYCYPKSDKTSHTKWKDYSEITQMQ